MTELDQWLAHLRDAHKVSPHTIDAYGRDVRRFLESLPSPASALHANPETLSRYLQMMASQGVKSATLIRATAALRNFFLFLVHLDRMNFNPADGLTAPEVAEPELPVAPGEITPEMADTAASMVGEMSDTPWIQARDRALFLFMVDHGLKIGEALSLKLGDLHEGVVFIAGSHHEAERQISLGQAARAAVETYLRRDPFDRPPERPLFVGLRGGALNPGVVQRQLRRLRGLLGLPTNMTPETLRQAFAKRRLREGQSLSNLQRELGHRHRRTTTKLVQEEV